MAGDVVRYLDIFERKMFENEKKIREAFKKEFRTEPDKVTGIKAEKELSIYIDSEEWKRAEKLFKLFYEEYELRDNVIVELTA